MLQMLRCLWLMLDALWDLFCQWLTWAFVTKEVHWDRVYEQHGLFVDDDSLVVEVGANTGIFAGYVNRVARGCTMYCFEPAPRPLEQLRRQVCEAGRPTAEPHPLPLPKRQNNELRMVAMTIFLCQRGIRELSICCSWPSSEPQETDGPWPAGISRHITLLRLAGMAQRQGP